MTDFPAPLLQAIESELQSQVARLDAQAYRPFYEMLSYHMGWTVEGERTNAGGKRIRPLLLLLVTVASQGAWLHATPAAAGIELIHNFSLVHDDIQDNSPKRRGRTTVWKKWGMPLGINVGDALFVIANVSMLDLSKNHPVETVLKAATILQNACLDLTRGQYLDISFENRTDLTVDDYWQMIEGKTAALLAASTQIGAILGNTDEATVEAYRNFGRDLGLAFQVQDDILGIWGNEARTGKSTASDLVEGKNSLPILYGISQKGRFAQRWSASGIRPEEVSEISQMLIDEGAYDFAQEEARRLTSQSLSALESANPQGDAGETIYELANKLLNRES